MSDKPDLKAIRERAEKTSPGTWKLLDRSTTFARDEDRVFVEHAHEDIPALLDYADRLKDKLVEERAQRNRAEGAIKVHNQNPWDKLPIMSNEEWFKIEGAATEAREGAADEIDKELSEE